MGVEGKVAIVTGASAGIGRAYALALAGAGATVIAAARTLGRADREMPERNTLTEVVRSAEPLPGRIFAQVCDMENEVDIAQAVGQAAANLGRIDVLVNNAGLLWSSDPLDISCEDWDRLMRTNLRGPYLATKHVAPHMMRQRSGSIINITAAAGELAPDKNFKGTLAYAISKAGLNRLSYFMAAELKPYGIAVNSLSPGYVLSDTAAARRPEARAGGKHKPATPEVMGPALLHLAQQSADTLTGQILHTDEFGKSWPVEEHQLTESAGQL
jgi:NAD(P)-dependent dehydrogenase (short-subunit alcohol dehydrogenase family)